MFHHSVREHVSPSWAQTVEALIIVSSGLGSSYRIHRYGHRLFLPFQRPI